MKAIRYSKIVSLLFYFSSALISQTDTSSFAFPLEIGDIWTYFVSNDLYAGHHYYNDITLRLDSDTLMPNGLRYFQMPPMSAFLNNDTTKRFLRKNGLKVYQFNAKDSSEFLRYDFSARIGDTITVFNTNPFQGIILKDTSTYPFDGVFNFKSLYFSSWETDNQGNLTPSDEWVIDSLGIEIHGDGYGTMWSLIGAKINGELYGTVLSVKHHEQIIPKAFHLYQNYPNPFNPTTKILFDLPTALTVRLSIYDYLGRELFTPLNEYEPAGNHEIIFDATNLSSGVYYCKIVSGTYSSVVKMLLIK